MGRELVVGARYWEGAVTVAGTYNLAASSTTVSVKGTEDPPVPTMVPRRRRSGWHAADRIGGPWRS